MTYSEEYRRTRCLECAKRLDEHQRVTADMVSATAGATYEQPVVYGGETFRSPISPTLIGQWLYHAPMPWPTAK
jgi:hypothetical protein